MNQGFMTDSSLGSKLRGSGVDLFKESFNLEKLKNQIFAAESGDSRENTSSNGNKLYTNSTFGGKEKENTIEETKESEKPQAIYEIPDYEYQKDNNSEPESSLER